MNNKNIFIFGGSGFVGFHLVQQLLKKNNRLKKIIIIDIKKPVFTSKSIIFINYDLKNKFDFSLLESIEVKSNDIVINLIALCRIPGYENHEYFNTNIKTGKNIISFTEKLKIRRLFFISSMSVYGSREDLVDEKTILMPDNPYGISKSLAEYEHRNWIGRNKLNKLIIFRPAIIFGKHENANMTRLVKAINYHYFFYPGRKNTIKSCVYVKDVVLAIIFFIERQPKENIKIFNLSNPDRLTIEEIVNKIKIHLNIKRINLLIPYKLLIMFGTIISFFLKISGKKNSLFDPDRIKKVAFSTNIDTNKILESGFKYKFDFDLAFKDWMNEEKIIKP